MKYLFAALAVFLVAAPAWMPCDPTDGVRDCDTAWVFFTMTAVALGLGLVILISRREGR